MSTIAVLLLLAIVILLGVTVLPIMVYLCVRFGVEGFFIGLRGKRIKKGNRKNGDET